MCTRRITADEASKLIGRLACLTHLRILVPTAVGKTPEVSLAVYTDTNEYNVDRRGEKVISRNPLEPIACSEHGQLEMLTSMSLGLSRKASILWVRLLSNFAEKVATLKLESEEVDSEKMSAMLNENYPFTDMMGVEVTLPCKKEATHWLVCQPLAEAENLCWNVLERDALDIWKTESNLYFIVPAGYQNVLFDTLGDKSQVASKEEFFVANADGFRKVCQHEWDAFIDIERQRKDKLPELIARAQTLTEQYRNLSMEPCLSDASLPELQFDEGSEVFVYGDEEPERLTEYTLKKFESVVEPLLQQVTDFNNQSRRAEGFRGILRDLEKNITIRDYYGILSQAVKPSRFGKTVEVDLDRTEAVITVTKGANKQQMRFVYANQGAASDFAEQLEKLGVKAKEYDDDYDEPVNPTPKRRFHEALVGLAKA